MAAGKYERLEDFLRSQGPRVAMTFDQVSAIVGGLPRSASLYPAWWANEHHGRHVQAQAWLAAGYRVVGVSLGHQVVFNRAE